MTRRPLVSIVLDTYNYASFLDRAIRSAVEQTMDAADYEIIVVDDGSTDETPDVASRWGSRIHYLRKENGGQASAFNAGVAAAAGEVVCFLDADDFFRTNKLERVWQAFCEDRRVVTVFNRYDVVNRNGDVLRRSEPRRLIQGDLRERTLLGFVAGSPSSGISVRREALLRIPIPEAEFRISADHFLLSVLPLLGPVAMIASAEHAYMLHGENLYQSRTEAERVAILKAQTERVWCAMEMLGATPFRALREIEDPGCSGRRRWEAVKEGVSTLRASKASRWLRAWVAGKLVARCLIGGRLFGRLQGMRRSLSPDGW